MRQLLTVAALAVTTSLFVHAQSRTGIPGTPALASSSSADTFDFIVAGENYPESATHAQPATPGQIFAAAATKRVAFVVWTGGMIYGLDAVDTAPVDAQYAAFFKLAGTAKVPVFAAPSNREMNLKMAKSGTTEAGSAVMEASYRRNMGLTTPAAIYNSFTYGNSHFVLLNSTEVAPPTVTRSDFAKPSSVVNLDPGYVSPKQMEWLRADLAQNTKLHTFVFMNHPIKPKKADMRLNKSSADELELIFKSHSNISYVLASHENLYYNPQTKDTAAPPSRSDPSTAPPVYLVSGGAGAKLTGSPDGGGFHHYLLFHVKGGEITAEVVKLP